MVGCHSFCCQALRILGGAAKGVRKDKPTKESKIIASAALAKESADKLGKCIRIDPDLRTVQTRIQSLLKLTDAKTIFAGLSLDALASILKEQGHNNNDHKLGVIVKEVFKTERAMVNTKIDSYNDVLECMNVIFENMMMRNWMRVDGTFNMKGLFEMISEVFQDKLKETSGEGVELSSMFSGLGI